MKELLDQIDKYLSIQEKKEEIEDSLHTTSDISKIIEIVKKSKDKKKALSMLDKEVRQKLMEGGIL